MSPLISILAIFFVVLAVIVPPIALARTVYKICRRRRGMVGFFTSVVAVTASLIPLGINLTYLRSVAPGMMKGVFEPDQMLAVALIVSWLALWGRMAVRRLRKRRLVIH